MPEKITDDLTKDHSDLLAAAIAKECDDEMMGKNKKLAASPSDKMFKTKETK